MSSNYRSIVQVLKGRRRIAVAFALGMICISLPALAREKPLVIELLGSGHNTSDPISFRLTNRSSGPITFCLSFCGSIHVDWIVPEIGANPVPTLDVQKRHETGWRSLLWGCDVGALDLPYVLEPGKTIEFRIRLRSQGTYRLTLSYRKGRFDGKCIEIEEQGKHVRSTNFVVVPTE